MLESLGMLQACLLCARFSASPSSTVVKKKSSIERREEYLGRLYSLGPWSPTFFQRHTTWALLISARVLSIIILFLRWWLAATAFFGLLTVLGLVVGLGDLRILLFGFLAAFVTALGNEGSGGLGGDLMLKKEVFEVLLRSGGCPSW